MPAYSKDTAPPLSMAALEAKVEDCTVFLRGEEKYTAPPLSLAALEAKAINSAQIGTVREKDFGIKLKRNDRLETMPVFAADEITRLFAN